MRRVNTLNNEYEQLTREETGKKNKQVSDRKLETWYK